MKNRLSLLSAALVLASTPATADIVHLDDVIIDGSLCVGFDCVNGEAFGFDTIRLKENNVRIKFQDTSSSASFPTNDWQLTANDSSNGGANKFSIDDIDGGRTPFTIEASAPSHSLYVDDGGRIGFGTNAPVVDLHVVSGNTPTLRLAQDGSSGFSPQTWDVAGNETNFFIRDATNGSTLPFRIFPGSSSNSIAIKNSDVGIGTQSPASKFHIENTAGDDVDDFVVDSDGNVGMGTTAPAAGLHLISNADPIIRLESAKPEIEFAQNDGNPIVGRVGLIGAGFQPRIALDISQNGDAENTSIDLFRFTVPGSDNRLVIYQPGTGTKVFQVDADNGDVYVNTTKVHPDYVFQPNYALMPLEDLENFIEANRHLPGIPSASEVENGYSLTEMQLKLLEKTEEQALYIISLEKRLKELEIAFKQQATTIPEG